MNTAEAIKVIDKHINKGEMALGSDLYQALLVAVDVLDSREPTDDEIYNRPGVEGGIAYPMDHTSH